MRLTCPNCGAEYEVPDEVIPATGRDVQCSNCSDTWFQTHPDHPLPDDDGQAPMNPAEEPPRRHRPEEEEGLDEDGANAPQADAPIPAAVFNPPAGEDPEPPKPGPAPAPVPTPAAAPAPAAPPSGAKPDEGTEAPADDHTPPPPPLPEGAARHKLAPGVASVLRTEAEREQRARAASQLGLETQTELGLAGDVSESHRARAARLRRMARAENPATDPAADDRDENASAPRRSLYPAIEEINAAPPAPVAEPQTNAPAPPPTGTAGGKAFLSGVLLAILIALALLLLYLFAPQLADSLPFLSGPLADYSAWVDGLRQWLDARIARP